MPSWTAELDERIEQLPSWARPPFYGMLFVYMLAFARAFILLPLLVILILSGGPERVLQVLWILIVAGLAGFAGGAAFSIARALFRGFGGVGAFVTGWLSVFTYLCVALPVLSSDDPHSRDYFNLRDRVSWIVLAVMSILFGSILGAALIEEPLKPVRPRRAWVQRKQRVTSRVHPRAT